MTLFEYIITDLIKIDKSEIKSIVDKPIKQLYLYDFAKSLNYSKYLKRNEEQSKQLLGILFSVMFRLMKEEMKYSFYKFIINFNKETNAESYHRMNLLNKNNNFHKICAINYAFEWCATKEQFQFWRDIDHKAENKFLSLIKLDVDKFISNKQTK